MRLRKRLARRGWRSLLKFWLRFEREYLFRPITEYLDLLKRMRPSLVVSTNATTTRESEVISSAKSLGIKTLGVVGSWDRLHKFMYTRADHISVWNEINRQEAVELEGFERSTVHVTGPAQFDPYFDSESEVSKEDFCVSMGLDPDRPIIMLATAGSFVQGYDESYMLDWLMEQIGSGAIPRRPQVICRMHPFSRIEQFLPWGDHPDVRLSHMRGYIPTLGYTMSREEVVQVSNMLRHADVVVTPGSTMTIEAAIFDTPVVVPVFHLYQNEMCERYYRTRVFGRHFGRIRQRNLVPIVYGPNDTLQAINRCIDEPAWMREQRRELVADYCQFTDGQSTKRLADLALRLASNGAAL
jgi:CDP-glycerol glycerophosphotransferase (TagB/SpsB family)